MSLKRVLSHFIKQYIKVDNKTTSKRDMKIPVHFIIDWVVVDIPMHHVRCSGTCRCNIRVSSINWPLIWRCMKRCCRIRKSDPKKLNLRVASLDKIDLIYSIGTIWTMIKKHLQGSNNLSNLISNIPHIASNKTW